VQPEPEATSAEGVYSFLERMLPFVFRRNAEPAAEAESTAQPDQTKQPNSS
jgi:hypothetical protein